MAASDRPTISVGIGLTTSPKKFHSIRVDVEYQGVYVDGSNLDEVMTQGRPIVERLFANLLAQADAELNDITQQRYGSEEKLPASNPLGEGRDSRMGNVPSAPPAPPEPRSGVPLKLD